MPYSVLTAAAIATVVRARSPGVTRLVARDGNRTQLVQQVIILRGLTCGKLRSKNLLVLLCNLGILRFDTLRSKRIKHRTRIGVLVLNDVPRAVLDSLARVAGLRSKVVIYALNRFAGFAAAICLLHLHCIQLLHKCRLLVCAADFRRHKALLHSVLHTVYKLRLCIETIAQAVVYVVNLAFDVGKVAGEDVAINRTAAGSACAVAAKAITAPATCEDEQEQNYQLEGTIVTPAAKPAISSACISGLHRHCHHSAVRR